MLVVKVNTGKELFDEAKSEFTYGDAPFLLRLEHSLVSLSKWEESFEKPFLNNTEKTSEETIAYIKAMCLDEEIPEGVFLRLSSDNFQDIQNYIVAKRTATWFVETPSKSSGEVITSELLYYWMISFNIPIGCENWHLSRLLTLIRVCQHKNAPTKKMSRAEIARRQRDINARRRSEFNTTG